MVSVHVCTFKLEYVSILFNICAISSYYFRLGELYHREYILKNGFLVYLSHKIIVQKNLVSLETLQPTVRSRWEV